jgi:fermentation-respiration switch protein FrsA (DUF1100 family)
MGAAVSSLVFQPPAVSYERDVNLIWLQTALHDVVPAFFIDRDARLTLLFSHGNAEDLGMILQYFRELSQDLKVNVFCYEYVGYGLSTGTPSEEGVLACAEAAFKYVRDILGIPWNKVVLYGRSLGSGPSVHLAALTAARGLILQAPLMSTYRVAMNFRFTLEGDAFPNIDLIDKVVCPTYIIHGTKDEIVPVSHGEELYRKLRNPYSPYFVDGGGHNNLEVFRRQEFFHRLYDFLLYLEKTPPTKVETDFAHNCAF